MTSRRARSAQAVSGVAFDNYLTDKGGGWLAAEIDSQGVILDSDWTMTADRHQIAEALAWKPATALMAWQWAGVLAENQGEVDAARTYVDKALGSIDDQTTPWQVALHMVNHSTLHRGQIISMIRGLGKKPPNLDLFTFYWVK